ncbi:hypothetical protein EI291_04825 [Hymenobacter rigui]|uniref:Lipoprotein n=1 Tax=Hymenobacter rigui TaxID=334424 RepID=A0A3R9NLQ5_9BACT|nr:hypothetical protein EI291_04825 [Hymenobacter rigui]
MPATPAIVTFWGALLGIAALTACTTQSENPQNPLLPDTEVSVMPVSSATHDTFSISTPHTVKVYLNSRALYRQAVANGITDYLQFSCKSESKGLSIVHYRLQQDTAYVTFDITDPTAFKQPVDVAHLKYSFALDLNLRRPGIDSTFNSLDVFYISSKP